MPAAKSPALPFRTALPYLLLFMGLFYCNFVARVILSPLLAPVKSEFGISHASAGGLFFFVATGMSVALACSGFVAARLQHRRTVLLSTLLLGTGMLAVSQAPNYDALRATLLFTGLSAGLYFPSALSSITSLLDPSDWGKGVSVHELAPNLAFITVPALAASMADILPWRSVFQIFGVLTLVMGGVFALFGRGGRFHGEAPRPSALREVVLTPSFPVLVVVFSLAVASSFGPYSMLPLYLVHERGMDLEAANGLLTASRLAGPFMALGTGLMVDRVGARRTAALSLTASGSLTFLLGPLSGVWLSAAVILQPVLSVCFFTAGVTALSQVFSDRLRNVAVSLVVPSAVLAGSGATPTILGWFGDRGEFGTGFMILGACIVGGMPLLRFLRFSPPDETAEDADAPVPPAHHAPGATAETPDNDTDTRR